MFFLAFLVACGSKESNDTPKEYFDIQGYFTQEAERLQKQNPVVKKTVWQNSQPETKQLQLADWQTELELFSESDINKAAWKDSYRVVKKGLTTEYTSLDKDLRTQKVLVRFSDGSTVKQISILNRTSNPLYSSREQLDYFPDSLYKIAKHQDVRLIGESSYLISSKFP